MIYLPIKNKIHILKFIFFQKYKIINEKANKILTGSNNMMDI